MMKTSKVLHRNPAKTWFWEKISTKIMKSSFFEKKYGKTNFVLVCYSKENYLKDTMFLFLWGGGVARPGPVPRTI